MQGDDKFVLAWRTGQTTVDSIDVPRSEVVTRVGAVDMVRFPELAARVASEWRTKGQHVNPTDRKLDQVVLHTDNKTEFKYVVGVIDAIDGTRREMRVGTKTERVSAFNVTFAMN
jgi:hypothetical protein